MSLEFPFTSSVSPIQAGGLIAFNASQVVARFGVSMISSAQACSNAEDEVPTTSDGAWDWDAIMANSNNEWEGVLSRVLIDVEKENSTVVELLYSSVRNSTAFVPLCLLICSSALSCLSHTGEFYRRKSILGLSFSVLRRYVLVSVGLLLASPFCSKFRSSWDVFRTVHPLLSLTSPQEWSQIVNAYVDGWRNTGYIPECRANTKACVVLLRIVITNSIRLLLVVTSKVEAMECPFSESSLSNTLPTRRSWAYPWTICIKPWWILLRIQYVLVLRSFPESSFSMISILSSPLTG